MTAKKDKEQSETVSGSDYLSLATFASLDSDEIQIEQPDE